MKRFIFSGMFLSIALLVILALALVWWIANLPMY